MCIDRKAINKVCIMILSVVAKKKSRTRFSHLLAVLVHARPEVSLTNTVVDAVHIEVPANGIGVEGHRDDVG